ncbi:MAG: 4-(cytidine 5'-diphospho)-2-C-methyl-D-erythritol kinase [bacterium]|nr:4-(cytidine 5'-diphospho)-2-C-methyl-D-erythritol kinase [bacterium]
MRPNHILRPLKALAPAKINLGLEVVRRRRDGYHDIETLFQTIDIQDKLEFTICPETNDLSLRLKGISSPEGDDNIVSRVYNLMCRDYPERKTGLKVVLDKSIPLGAGLGGGSSDAAATILAINRLWRLKLSHERLQTLALEIGSDVPFLLQGGTAIGRGRGEELTKMPYLSQGAFLLVNPGFSISTAWAYEGLKMGLTGNPYRIRVEQVKAYLHRFPASGMLIRNRFEDVVYPSYPEYNAIVDRLDEVGAIHVSMSGSGAVVYGTFPDRRAAEKARDDLEGKWQGIVACPHPNGVILG